MHHHWLHIIIITLDLKAVESDPQKSEPKTPKLATQCYSNSFEPDRPLSLCRVSKSDMVSVGNKAQPCVPVTMGAAHNGARDKSSARGQKSEKGKKTSAEVKGQKT